MSTILNFRLIHPIRPPHQVSPAYRGSLAIPNGIVWYRDRSDAEQDHQHLYDQLRNLDDYLREAFESPGQTGLIVPFDKQETGSVSNGLRKVIHQFGPAGAIPFLEKLMKINSTTWTSLTRKNKVVPMEDARDEAKDGVVVPDEQGEKVYEQMTEEEVQQLATLRNIKRFISEQRMADDQTSIPVNDKMNKLLQLLRLFEREADGPQDPGDWKCFLVVKDDLTAKTLHKLLVHHQISTASLSTETLAEAAGDTWNVNFDQADYNVLLVPVFEDIKWQLAPCTVVHYDMIGSEAAKKMPLQKCHKRPGHHFYVFREEDDSVGDVRLKQDYGLQLDPRNNIQTKDLQVGSSTMSEDEKGMLLDRDEDEIDDSLLAIVDVHMSDPEEQLPVTALAVDSVQLPVPTRRRTLADLGIPARGIPTIRSKDSQLHLGPHGRTLFINKAPNPHYDALIDKKGSPFSFVELTNNQSDARVTDKSAVKVFDDVNMQMNNRGYGSIVMREIVSATQGAAQSKAFAFDSPPIMGLDTIISDTGSRVTRARELAYLTYVAALYMSGWLDHQFEFVPGGPSLVDGGSVDGGSIRGNREEVVVSEDSASEPMSEVHQAAAPVPTVHPATRPLPFNPNLPPRPVAPWNDALMETSKAGPSRVPDVGRRNRRDRPDIPTGEQSAIESKTPKFWKACTPLSVGSYCATLCRIKPIHKQEFDREPRQYRTMCILTRHRFSLPMGRPLPTCKGVIVVEAVLEQGFDLKFDAGEVAKAQAYTLTLFSIPRRRPLHSVPGKLPYLILPMSRSWNSADKATSEVNSTERTNIGKNIAWKEIEDALANESRTVTGLESGGQGLATLAEESVYVIGGSQYNEVVEIRRDEEARLKAENRANHQATKMNRRSPRVSGPVFKLRPIPDFWNTSPRVSTPTEMFVCPKNETPSTIAKSIYHSAYLLPWIMWTIDSLLLAQEVNMKYLGSRADTYDVLAALSTTASSRHVDCEVLEFAGDTYWKLAATAYYYYTSPTHISQQLAVLVRSITDNVPLAEGMHECGAAEYILNEPIDSTTFVPPGCGYKNSPNGPITEPPKRPTRSIADVAEALAGAVGKLKDHELILQTCMRLFPRSFPSPITWQDIAQTSSSLNYGRDVASLRDVASIQVITGHAFTNRNLLGMIMNLKGRQVAVSTATATKLTFLGGAIFEYSKSRQVDDWSRPLIFAPIFLVLMSYLIEQGATQNLGPGQLTRWRSPMYSHVSLAALWVSSGLYRHVQNEPVAVQYKVMTFQKELQKTIDTQTELSLAWTRLVNPPRVEDYIYTLFAGVLIDSGWCFDATRALFNKLCLPFFARFIGTHQRDRLTAIPEPNTANQKLQAILGCKMIYPSMSRGEDELYRTTVKCHDRVIGDAYSVYKAAAQGFAYREALATSLDPALRSELSTICTCYQSSKGRRVASGRGAGGAAIVPKSAGSPAEIRQVADRADESSDDGFEIIENPYPVAGDSSSVASAIRKASVVDLSDTDDSYRKQFKRRRRSKN